MYLLFANFGVLKTTLHASMQISGLTFRCCSITAINHHLFQCFCHIIQILVFTQNVSFKLILWWQFYTSIAPRQLQLIFYKGTMSWDFQHQVFFMNSFSYGPWYPVRTISKIFKKLVNIFKTQGFWLVLLILTESLVQKPFFVLKLMHTWTYKKRVF